MTTPSRHRTEPELIRVFDREDLKDRVANGFMMVFRPERTNIDMMLNFGEQKVEILRDRLRSDWKPFVNRSVDEFMNEFLLALIDGTFKISGNDEMSKINGRLMLYEPHFREDRHAASSIDHANYCDPLGFGLFSGWVLKADEAATRVQGFVIAGSKLVPVEVKQNTLKHHGLDKLGNHLMKTKQDGFFGIMHPVPDMPPPTKVFLLVHSGRRAQLVCRNIRQSGRQSFMGYMNQMSILSAYPELVMPFMEVNSALHEVAEVARRAPVPLERSDDSIAMLLDHDAGDRDIREVIRRMTETYSGKIILQPISPSPSPQLAEAIRGAMTEAGPDRLDVLPPSRNPDVAELAKRAPVLVYGRSSALIQLDGLEDSIREVAGKSVVSVMFQEAMMRERSFDAAADKRLGLEVMAKGTAPFYAVVSGELVTAIYPHIERTFLTLDARMRGLGLAAFKADLPVELRAFNGLHCFAGLRSVDETVPAAIEAAYFTHDGALFRSLDLGVMQ